jgi:hypothetical protein
VSVVLAMILNTGITTHTPVHDLQELYRFNKPQITFKDITELTRMCQVQQYGIYFPDQIAFQIAGCVTDTIFKSGFEKGETNKPQP